MWAAWEAAWQSQVDTITGDEGSYDASAEQLRGITRSGVLRFTDLRDNAELAAEIVERIRIDEAIHVRSLNLYLGEMRSLSFRTLDGGTVSGAELIDRFWSGLVNWATVEQPKLAADETRQMLHGRIAVHDEADRVLAEFEAAA